MGLEFYGAREEGKTARQGRHVTDCDVLLGCGLSPVHRVEWKSNRINEDVPPRGCDARELAIQAEQFLGTCLTLLESVTAVTLGEGGFVAVIPVAEIRSNDWVRTLVC